MDCIAPAGSTHTADIVSHTGASCIRSQYGLHCACKFCTRAKNSSSDFAFTQLTWLRTGNINVDLVNRIAAMIEWIAFVNDKERRQFDRAVRRAATLAEMPERYQQLLRQAEQPAAQRLPPTKKAP
jgi:hypothetical protein